MDKSKGFDTSKVTIPLLEYLLEGVLDDPQRFIEDCNRKLAEFKAGIEPKFPKDMVEERAFYLLCYIELKRLLGQNKAYEIVRIVFLADGIVRMNLAFDTAHGRSFEKLVDKTIALNTPPNAPEGALKIVEHSRDRFEINLVHCVYWELCCSLDIPEATTLICQVDDAFFNSYLPEEVRFSHGSPCTRLVDGAQACRFIFTRILGLSKSR